MGKGGKTQITADAHWRVIREAVAVFEKDAAHIPDEQRTQLPETPSAAVEYYRSI
jgi:hypothetical protein